MNIVFLDRDTFAPGIRFDTAPLGTCAWREYPVTPPELVVERAREADVVLTNKVRLPGAVLEQLPRLRLIAATATGVDNIDTAAARSRNIGVCNVRGYAERSVPEHVFALLFALRRNLLAYHCAARDGRWSHSPMFCLHGWPIEDLAGSTLGIIGGGTLGQAVKRVAESLGLRVLVAGQRGTVPNPGRVAFEELLRQSDAVTLHVPLTPATRHLIGAAELALMKPGAVLINTARGGVVDEVALLAALRSGQLGGAALDVLGVEPPPADHPLLSADLPNLIVTPHVAWASRQAQQRLADEVIENIAAFVRGELRNRVV
jgi:glycerate dehydrogenase